MRGPRPAGYGRSARASPPVAVLRDTNPTSTSPSRITLRLRGDGRRDDASISGTPRRTRSQDRRGARRLDADHQAAAPVAAHIRDRVVRPRPRGGHRREAHLPPGSASRCLPRSSRSTPRSRFEHVGWPATGPAAPCADGAPPRDLPLLGDHHEVTQLLQADSHGQRLPERPSAARSTRAVWRRRQDVLAARHQACLRSLHRVTTGRTRKGRCSRCSPPPAPPLVVLSLITLSATLVAPMARQRRALAIYPPDSRPLGKSYGESSTLWSAAGLPTVDTGAPFATAR